ncbi:unnamed protein product [Phytophthora fragariaefolia]|uniref:Unnamed protein product n=1 Tax=Phytophthora fragariaefolia TaxID=1490495 RepID=A0A9W7CV04_9STRA|nr:unnamed protein product [Phytophthora fragariaefolia]
MTMASLDHLLCSQSTDGDDPATRFVSTHSLSSQVPLDTAKPNPRRCSIESCKKTAKRGGRCIAHGGGNKCAVDGCTTSVVSRGLCVAHGGGKRCQAPACTKSAQSGGFCWVHGGGKKCGYGGCPKRAQSGGACIAHGKMRSHVTVVSTMDTCRLGHTKYQTTPLALRSESHIGLDHHSTINDDSARPPSPVRPATHDLDAIRCRESRVAPDLAALLNADDEFSSFSTCAVPTSQRYTRHRCTRHARHLYHEQEAHPVLPGIHALQSYQIKIPPWRGRTGMGLSDLPDVRAKITNSRVRIAVTENLAKLRRMLGPDSDDAGQFNSEDNIDYTEGLPSAKLFLHSYEFRSRGEFQPCTSGATLQSGRRERSVGCPEAV